LARAQIIFASLAVSVLLPGCATKGVDWNSLVGTYTYDQAVLDLGPPDKYAKVTDGTVVADWMTRRGQSGSYVSFVGGAPFYRPYYYGGPAYAYSTAVSTPDYFTRLTFGPDGKLQAWKKYVR
jgi:hypothetical protein